MIDVGQADVLIAEIASKQVQIAAIEQEAKQIKEARITEVDKWYDKKIEPLKNDIDIAKAMLLPFVEEHIAAMEKATGIVTKSINLPSGRAGFRKGNTTFSFTDEQLATEKIDGKSAELLKVVKDHNLDDYVVKKEYADWYKLKKSLIVTDEGKVVTSDGEVLPELAAKVEPDKFYVKVGD